MLTRRGLFGRLIGAATAAVVAPKLDARVPCALDSIPEGQHSHQVELYCDCDAHRHGATGGSSAHTHAYAHSGFVFVAEGESFSTEIR